jgi:SulP family sulfate permease
MINDFWGGLAAMLVALPSAIAFGVTIYAVFGGSYGSYGAIAGIMGVVMLGVIASLLGGTKRLISAPCAPATALLSAFVIERLASGIAVETAVIMVALVGLLAGVFQVVFGLLKIGTLIRLIPYPVVSGYLSGVGLYIIVSQVPKFLGTPKGLHFSDVIFSASLWSWQSVVVGGMTALSMIVAPFVIKKIPSVIVALVMGVGSYWALCLVDPSLCVLAGNHLVIGPLSGGIDQIVESFSHRMEIFGAFSFSNIALLIVPALTLAVLLSIDTLKTCVVLDALTCSRHNSNKELIGQGCGNMACACVGGMPGAGTMGATLVNISSGGETKLSGVMEGLLALFAFLVLSSFIAWIPIASLAAILIVIGVKMIDRHSFSYLKKRSTILDFCVILAVIVTALSVSLIAASGVGIMFAVVLYLREQIGTSIVHSKSYGNTMFSKQMRIDEEMEILQNKGDQVAIYELQGALFFGTASQLFSAVENDIKTKKYLIFDMRRVQSVDLSAAHMLEQIEQMLALEGKYFILSHVPISLPSGQDVKNYLGELGVVKEAKKVLTFDELDDALLWVEDHIIEKSGFVYELDRPFELEEFDLFKGRKEQTLKDLSDAMKLKTYECGETIFSAGDLGDEIYLIRKGSVRIELPSQEGRVYHISTFGQGNFFGEMGFLDGQKRSANAVASKNTELFILSRENFDIFSLHHKKTALRFIEGLASVLASRLRIANNEIRALDD